MGLRWNIKPKPGRKETESELIVVSLDKTSKPVKTIVIPTVYTNNQHVPDMIRVTNICNISVNEGKYWTAK